MQDEATTGGVREGTLEWKEMVFFTDYSLNILLLQT